MDKKNQEKSLELKDKVTFNKPNSVTTKDLDKASIESLMKRPLEGEINRWKKEIDKQAAHFNENGEKLKHFEIIFNKNFENVIC